MRVGLTRLTRGPLLIVRAARRLSLELRAPGRVHLGQNAVVGPGARVARGAVLRTGSNVSIGANFVCEVELTVGNDVMISSNVSFIGNDHSFDEAGRTITQQGPHPRARATVKGDNLIGFGTIVLGSLTIGHGAIVGAGSLVTASLPDEMIAFGRPARAVRPRR